MFAAANPFRTPSFSAQSNAYRQIGVTSAVDGANPHRLVGMLYDGLLESIAEARGALRTGNVEMKCRSVSRAVRGSAGCTCRSAATAASPGSCDS